MMLWMKITKLTKIILISNGFSKLTTNVSITALTADSPMTRTTDSMLNCCDNQTPLHTRFRIKRKSNKT